MGRGSTFFKPRFWYYVYRRLYIFCQEIVNGYERARTGTNSLIYRGDLHVSDFRYLQIDSTSLIDPGVRILTPQGQLKELTGLYLGRSTWLGRGTELEIRAGEVIS